MANVAISHFCSSQYTWRRIASLRIECTRAEWISIAHHPTEHATKETAEKSLRLHHCIPQGQRRQGKTVYFSALGKFTGGNTHDLCSLTSWASHDQGLSVTQHPTICKQHVRASPSQIAAPEFSYDVVKTHWAQWLYKVGTWPMEWFLTITAPERHLTVVPGTGPPVRQHSAKGVVCQAFYPRIHRVEREDDSQMLSCGFHIK